MWSKLNHIILIWRKRIHQRGKKMNKKTPGYEKSIERARKLFENKQYDDSSIMYLKALNSAASSGVSAMSLAITSPAFNVPWTVLGNIMVGNDEMEARGILGPSVLMLRFAISAVPAMMLSRVSFALNSPPSGKYWNFTLPLLCFSSSSPY